MGDSYLSLLFPHPEWNGQYENYASDFRSTVTDETQGDSWIFEVRTRTVGVKTIIRWQEGDNNPIAILPGSQLLDNDTGAVLIEDTSLISSYVVDSTDAIHAYVWKYPGQPPPEPPVIRVMPWLYLLL